jgi:hypothetical protein
MSVETMGALLWTHGFAADECVVSACVFVIILCRIHTWKDIRQSLLAELGANNPWQPGMPWHKSLANLLHELHASYTKWPSVATSIPARNSVPLTPRWESMPTLSRYLKKNGPCTDPREALAERLLRRRLRVPSGPATSTFLFLQLLEQLDRRLANTPVTLNWEQDEPVAIALHPQK